jgi:tetratricopeptide (TPR) repeat protein
VDYLKKPMNIRIAVIIISCLTLAACRQTEKSKETMKQAMDVYLFAELNDSIKIDSSLSLTNKALAFDDQNFSALNHKATLLFRKKDSKGLIQVAEILIDLTNKPFYLGQKAMYLELEGKTQEAKEYYSKAIKKYNELLRSDSLNFDLMIEYVGILEASGDSLKADKILYEIKEMDFKDYQIEMIDLYKEQAVSKKQLIKYWTGEIEYEQIGEK